MLATYQKVNLPAIVQEHFNIVMSTKDGRHGLAYGFWLNRVFVYYNVECGKGMAGSVKQAFNLIALEDNEYIPKRGNGKSRSLVSEQLDAQRSLKDEVNILTALVT